MAVVCPFKPGSYIIEEAYIVSANSLDAGVEISDSVLDVLLDPRGNTLVDGHGLVHNVSLVNLLENYQEFDIVMNMGENFCFYLRRPVINAGKVFTPGVKSILRFTPGDSFEHISDERFYKIKERLHLF